MRNEPAPDANVAVRVFSTGMSEKFVDAPPAGAESWREVWAEDRRFPPRTSKLQPLLAYLLRIFRRVNEPDADRQRNYNIALLDVIADARREIDALRAAIRGDIEAVQRDVRTADEALARDLARDLAREISAASARAAAEVRTASMRNDALIVALDQKIETIAVRLRDLTNPLLQQPPAAAPAAADLLYRRLEDGLRGSGAGVREAIAPYVELAAAHQPLFDAGCGRGELLLACREAGLECSGCDTNERSVADLRVQGLDVALAPIPECFAGIAGGALGSIAAMHVVEHLPVDVLFALFREGARTLRPGGLLMIETPNAESILVTASQFWRDPTHLAPRHPAALVLLGREHGFDVQEVRPVHEFPPGTAIAVHDDDPAAVRRLVEAINERLFAPQDLRLILRKR